MQRTVVTDALYMPTPHTHRGVSLSLLTSSGALHGTHCALLSLGRKEPAGHDWHALAPMLANVPAPHAVHIVAPAFANEPSLHLGHEFTVALVREERPASQAAHVVLLA